MRIRPAPDQVPQRPVLPLHLPQDVLVEQLPALLDGLRIEIAGAAEGHVREEAPAGPAALALLGPPRVIDASGVVGTEEERLGQDPGNDGAGQGFSERVNGGAVDETQGTLAQKPSWSFIILFR